MKRTYEVNQATYRTPGKRTWVTIKVFDNPGRADAWLCDLCRKNGYSITDFTIKAN